MKPQIAAQVVKNGLIRLEVSTMSKTKNMNLAPQQLRDLINLILLEKDDNLYHADPFEAYLKGLENRKNLTHEQQSLVPILKFISDRTKGRYPEHTRLRKLLTKE